MNFNRKVITDLISLNLFFFFATEIVCFLSENKSTIPPISCNVVFFSITQIADTLYVSDKTKLSRMFNTDIFFTPAVIPRDSKKTLLIIK